MDHLTLADIENNRKITRETDREFLYAYRKAILLALLESGRLTELQYRSAEEQLRQQSCS